MVQIKNVAVFGGAGALGAPVLKAILDSGKFTVTAISREASTATFPEGVKVVKVDYESLESVTSALKGQDAVVSTVGTSGFLGQKLFIDAAIAAGVKRIIPSEFGCNLANPKAATLPVFAYKVEVRKHLEAKVAAGADITYTYIENNAFLDWGLDMDFIINWRDGKPKIYDDGNQLTSVTTLASVGTAVVGVLSHYEETKNRSVYIHDLAVSQNQLLKIAQKADPSRKFEPFHVTLADITNSSWDGIKKGDFSWPVMAGFLMTAVYAEGYGGHFEKVDNELLGLSGKTEADVEAIFKELYAKQK